MARYSQTIARRVATDSRLATYDADLDGHWVVLEDGYNVQGGQIVHEWTVSDLMRALTHIEEGTVEVIGDVYNVSA